VNISKHILFETICLHEFIGGLIWGMPYRRSGCFFCSGIYAMANSAEAKQDGAETRGDDGM